MNTRYPPRQVAAHFYRWLPIRRIHKSGCWHRLWTFLLLHTTRATFEAICTALRLLNLHQNKFERAVIFSDPKATVLSAGSTETKISPEVRGCQDLIRQLKAKHKQIALQWIPGHCQIAENEQADTLAEKGTKITQIHVRETYYHTFKLHLKQVFQSVYRHEL